MRNIKPKIREYTIKDIPNAFIDTRNFSLEYFLSFLPINTKYYSVISHKLIEYGLYFQLKIKLEKLQNLKSYYKKRINPRVLG